MGRLTHAFHWVLRDRDGVDLRTTQPFASREEAEAWMGGEWASLLEEGAESVALLQDSRVIYEMGLREA